VFERRGHVEVHCLQAQRTGHQIAGKINSGQDFNPFFAKYTRKRSYLEFKK
jgi:hypothetical protein